MSTPVDVTIYTAVDDDVSPIRRCVALLRFPTLIFHFFGATPDEARAAAAAWMTKRDDDIRRSAEAKAARAAALSRRRRAAGIEDPADD